MNTERNCQFCKNYKDGYCENLELKPCYPQKGCDDFSKRNELKKDTMQVLEAYISPNGVGFPEVKDAIKDLLEWSKNEYKRGWHDALEKAFDEAHTIHSEEGSFRVVQIETLMGLDSTIDDLQTESEGGMIWKNSKIEKNKEKLQKQ